MTYDALVPAAVAATLTLYKVVGPAGEPLHGGSGTWPLPVGDAPGEWWDVPGEVRGCRTGLHVTDAAHLAMWARSTWPLPVVYRVETRGPLYRVADGDKYVCGSARLLPRKPRKGPDVAAVTLRHNRAQARATRRYERANRTLRRTLGDGWARYVETRGYRLWPDMPERVRVAVQSWTAEHNAADNDRHEALRKYTDGMARALLDRVA